MKLSQFKKAKTTKKLVFYANGSSEIETPERHLEGEINFKDINGDFLDELVEIFRNEGNDVNEMQLIYTLISLISDIEVDLTLEEFTEMYQNPSIEFVQLASVMMETMNEIVNKFKIYEKILEETNKIDNTIEEIDNLENNPVIDLLPPIIETVESEPLEEVTFFEEEIPVEEDINIYDGLDISELQSLLRETNDRRARLEIIKQINKVVYNQ